MPYKIVGKCIYKKDTGAKVGCTKGDVHKYMAALQMHAHESVQEDKDQLNEIRNFIKETLSDMFVVEESKKKKIDAGDEIHLPDLTMKKKDLLDYLKRVYKLELKNNE